jgi:hypothetical protein
MGDNPSKYTKIILKGYEMILKNHNIAEINKLSAPMVKIKKTFHFLLHL